MAIDNNVRKFFPLSSEKDVIGDCGYELKINSRDKIVHYHLD
jgi:hypothetical protein